MTCGEGLGGMTAWIIAALIADGRRQPTKADGNSEAETKQPAKGRAVSSCLNLHALAIDLFRVGIVQSLLTTCRLHEINPYDYLVDVLQRVGRHPVSGVADLTPRLWKQHFAANPLRSDLHGLSLQ